MVQYTVKLQLTYKGRALLDAGVVSANGKISDGMKEIHSEIVVFNA
jgi:hypothetical protein